MTYQSQSAPVTRRLSETWQPRIGEMTRQALAQPVEASKYELTL
jgi:hypothetical protein